MTTIQVPSPASDPADMIRWERLKTLERLSWAYLGRPPVVDSSDPSTSTLTFDPDLTAAEATLFGRLVRISALLQITPAEWASIEGDIDNARAYLNVASPTLVQTAGMLKGVIRMLRVLVRD